MAVINGPGIPLGTTPAAIKGDTNQADLQPIRIDVPTAQSNGNALEVYKAGALVLSIDVSGNILCASAAGLNTPSNGGLQTVAMVADANQTINSTQRQCGVLQIVGGATPTATRDIVLPVTAGAYLSVFNGSTGVQALQFIGASGTGVTVANAKRAIIYCDGTNWVRVTADT